MSTTNPSHSHLDEGTIEHALHQLGGKGTTTEITTHLDADRLTVNIILKRLEKQERVTSHTGTTEIIWKIVQSGTGDSNRGIGL